MLKYSRISVANIPTGNTGSCLTKWSVAPRSYLPLWTIAERAALPTPMTFFWLVGQLVTAVTPIGTKPPPVGDVFFCFFVGRYLLDMCVLLQRFLSLHSSHITHHTHTRSLAYSLTHSLTLSLTRHCEAILHLYSFDSEFIEQISRGTERCRERTDPPMAQVRSCHCCVTALLLYCATPLLCYRVTAELLRYCATSSDCGCDGVVLWWTYGCCACVVLCCVMWMYTLASSSGCVGMCDSACSLL
jgi:hypothetical protein